MKTKNYFFNHELTDPMTRLIIWGVLTSGLLLTLLGAWNIKINVERLEELEFRTSCHAMERMIERRLDQHARVLWSGAAFFSASGVVTREEWRSFTQHLRIDEQLPGIKGYGFAVLIPREALAQHTQEIRSEGFPEYQVHPAGDRELYSSVIYFEPLSDRNRCVLGYDMFSEPVRRAAMERARDTDAAALSGKVILLVQDTGREVQDGALMYVPVYRNGLPTKTVEERRAAIIGWVYSPYRVNDLILGILGAQNGNLNNGLRLSIFDGEPISPESCLFDVPSGHDALAVKSPLEMRLPIEYNGHAWTLLFRQEKGGFGTIKYAVAWVTLGGGGICTLLVCLLLWVLLDTRRKAQQLAERMTADLQKSNEALLLTTERLSLAVRTGGIGIWDLDVVTNRLICDEQMFRLYNMTPSASADLFETWHARVHPDDLQRFDERVQLALQGKTVYDDDFRILWPDGTVRYMRGFASVQRDASGKALHLIGTNWDITAHYQAEAAIRESESNFRTFFETMTDMIMVVTQEGRILFTNSAVTRTLGYTADELMGMHLLALHPADTRQEAEAIFSAMFRGERESCPLPLVSQNGARVPVETRIWLGKWNGEQCVFGICKNLSVEQEAQQRFERLFRYNPSLIALTTLPGRRFTDVNDAFLSTLGYAREDIIGRTSAELNLFVNPEHLSRVAQHLSTSGSLKGFEMQVRCKDGTLLDGLFSGEVITSQGQQYFLSVMTDITARKHAEMELARLSVIQNALMRLATEFVNVPLERQDEAIDQSLETMGRLIHADRAYLFAYDFEAGVMTNTHEWCQEGIPPEIGNLQSVPTERFRDWVTSHQAGECIRIPSVEALPKESELWQILVQQGIRSLITLPLMQGSVCLGFVGFDAVKQERHWKEEEVALLQVLAELYAHFESRRNMERETQELQKRLTEARDAAQEAARAKSLFLANMSHEIRTPLNVILGYTQIMERECLLQACPMSQKLGSITRSGEHLLDLLNDLLELVRSETKEIKLSTGVFDFYQALEDVRLIFVKHPAAQVLTLQVSYTQEVPRFICSDSGKVRQVLVNLVSNALKFTERGGVRLSASLLPDSASETLTLAVDVEDTGCGIRPEEQEHLFELFYTHTERGGKAPKGTGLGLPLCQRYARALGGDIALIRSVPGEGSCFRFTFQIREADPAALEQRHKGVVRRLAPNQPPFRVLVVDDDAANREMLVDLLEPLGITVETDASAINALHHLRQSMACDLVLLDKRMPEMDGYEAIRHLREMPGGEKIIVLVVSASGDGDEREAALAAGANGYVSKPVHRDKLLEEIRCVTGLQYEYEPQEVMIPQENRVVDNEAFSHVPIEVCRLLSQALQRGNIQQLRGLVESLERDHAALASGIRVLVDAYDYDRLRQLIEARGVLP